MPTPTAPLLVVGLGLLTAAAGWISWLPCYQGELVDCYALLNSRPVDAAIVILWILAIGICVFGLFSSLGRAGAGVGTILVAIAVPLLDPGIPTDAIDSADGSPGTGIITGAIIATGGILYYTLAEVDRRRVRAGLSPLSEVRPRHDGELGP